MVGETSGGRVRTVIGPWRTAIRLGVVLTAMTGLAYPMSLGVIGRSLFPWQAAGSLAVRDGKVVGSALIGQTFDGPGYFHSRPSAASQGYDGTASGGTNLGPSSRRLLEGDVPGGFAGVRDLATAYRERNGLPASATVPADAVTRSGSGLDPHISPENAGLQAARVARERGLDESVVRRLVAEHTRGRQFGLLGAPRVELLALNLALDRASVTKPSR